MKKVGALKKVAVILVAGTLMVSSSLQAQGVRNYGLFFVSIPLVLATAGVLVAAIFKEPTPQPAAEPSLQSLQPMQRLQRQPRLQDPREMNDAIVWRESARGIKAGEDSW